MHTSYATWMTSCSHKIRSRSFSRASSNTFPTTNRRPHSWQHHMLLGQKHLQQRWLLDQPCRQLHNKTPRGSRHEQLQSGTSARKQHYSVDGTGTQQRRTCSLPQDGWQITMDDIHKDQIFALQQRSSQDNWDSQQQQTTKVEAPILRYIKGTQPNNQDTDDRSNTWHSGICGDSGWAGCPATRTSTTGFLIKAFGATIHYCSRSQATIALSSAEAELYAINTVATEALHLNNFQKEVLNMKKINIRIHTDSSNTNCVVKESETHWTQTPVHTTAGRTRCCEDNLDQHHQQSGRRLHQIRCGSDVFASHRWYWDQHTVEQQFHRSMCERVHTVRTTCTACAHKHTSLWAMVSIRVGNMEYTIVTHDISTGSIPSWFMILFLSHPSSTSQVPTCLRTFGTTCEAFLSSTCVDASILLTTVRRANKRLFLWQQKWCQDLTRWSQHWAQQDPPWCHLVSPIWATCFDFISRRAHHGLLRSQHASIIDLSGQQGAYFVQQDCKNNPSAAGSQQCLGARCSRDRTAATVEAAAWQVWPDFQRPDLDQRSGGSYDTPIDLNKITTRGSAWDSNILEVWNGPCTMVEPNNSTICQRTRRISWTTCWTANARWLGEFHGVKAEEHVRGSTVLSTWMETCSTPELWSKVTSMRPTPGAMAGMVRPTTMARTTWRAEQANMGWWLPTPRVKHPKKQPDADMRKRDAINWECQRIACILTQLDDNLLTVNTFAMKSVQAAIPNSIDSVTSFQSTC